MAPLVCTVRGCAGPLVVEERVARCPLGHSYDRARDGYWNLLQPQDRRSREPGDSAAARQARARWIARGLADSLVPAIAGVARVDALAQSAVVADLGCGDGSLTGRLVAGREVDLCGIDLSAASVRLGARRWPDATWVVANADRFVPLASGSAALVLSLFGRRPSGEIARVMARDGCLVVAVPAADDLIELREAVQGRGERRERVSGVVEELAPQLVLEERRSWRVRASLDAPALADALAMTYRGARRAEQERLPVSELAVTLSAELLRFRPTRPDDCPTR